MHYASDMRIAASVTAKALGLGWLLAALGFATAAIGVGRGAAWGLLATAFTAALSIVLCIGAAPSKNTGFVIDVIILSMAALLQAGGHLASRLP